MKQLIILVISFTALIACEKDSTENTEDTIIGKWELIETLSDPGDGSGTWVSVSENSSYTYEFYNSNAFTRSNSNNDCNGNYLQENMAITLNCDGETNTQPTYNFSFNEQFLIFDGSPYSCDESCAEKFKRVIAE